MRYLSFESSKETADLQLSPGTPVPPPKTPDGECKFWLKPISLARNKGVDPITVRNIEKLVFEHLYFLEEKYNDFHRG